MWHNSAVHVKCIGSISLGLLLLSCGGSSGGGGSIPIPDPSAADPIAVGTLNGRFVLGDGKGRASSYSVVTPLGKAPINADGTFSVKTITSSPTPAMVVDNTGALVSYAYIDSTNSTIDNAAVARSLAILNLRPKALDAVLRKRLWASLKTSTDVSNLATALGTLGGHLTGAATDLTARQRTLLQPIVNNLNGTATRGLSIDPAEGGSGVSVMQTGLNQAFAQNSARRRCWVFVDRIEVKDAAGVVSPRLDKITDFSLDQVSNPQSISGALGDAGTVLGDQFSGGNPAYTGNVAWVPVQSDPVDLPVLPSDTIYTKYRFMVVGPGSTKNAPASMRTEWVEKRKELVLNAMLYDLAIPWISLAVGPLGDKVAKFDKLQDPKWQAAIGGLKDVIGAALATPGISQKIDGGDYSGAWADTMSYCMGSGAFTAARDAVAGYVFEEAMRAASQSFDQAAFTQFMQGVGSLMAKIDIGLTGFDSFMIVKNWATADAYLPFEITATSAKVKLSPQAAKLSFKSTVDLQATVPDATGDDAPYIQYNYTMTGQNSQFFKNLTSGATGTSMTTSDGKVQVVSQDRNKATITVTVEAIVKKPGQPDQSLGKATSKVSVLSDKAQLYPAMSSIKPKGSQRLEVRVNNAQATSQYMFKWSTSGKNGKLSTVSNQASANPTNTYVANDATGSDTVSVDVYQQSDQGLVLIGSSTCTVKIEEEPTIIPATFSPIRTENGTGMIAVVQFTPRPEFKSYTLYGVGGFDPNWYGESITNSSTPLSVLNNGDTVRLGGNLGWGLSGVSGSATGDYGPYVTWFNNRFGAFSFYVVASK